MRIDIEFTEDPSRYPNELVSVDYESWPDLGEIAEIRRRVLELYGETDKYAVQVHSDEYEWGASAAEVVLLITLGANLAELMGIGLRDVFAWATRGIREPQYLPADAAEEAARWRIALRWGVPATALVKMAEEQTTDPQGWKFLLVDSRGAKFGAVTEATESGVPIISISVDWTAIGGAPSRSEGSTSSGEED